jgi:hypothetical protein
LSVDAGKLEQAIRSWTRQVEGEQAERRRFRASRWTERQRAGAPGKECLLCSCSAPSLTTCQGCFSR